VGRLVFVDERCATRHVDNPKGWSGNQELRGIVLDYYPLLIPLAPLAAAFLTALPSRQVGEATYRVGALAHAVAFGIALLVLCRTASPEHATIRLFLFDSPWSFLPSVELAIDRLAAVMMVVISGIGTLLYRYSIRYMQQDRGRARYQTLLALAISTLLFMVASADLITLFVFWQLLSWLLCFLAHNYAHIPTAKSSFRTFIILRAGDIAFLAGIVLAYRLYGTVEFSQLFARAAADQTTFPLLWGVGGFAITGATAVTLLIFIGAMSKSAQFPLHAWLPDSLFAPTPIHGLLHAGIINAGGFLLSRLAPLYVLSPTTLHVVFAIGLVTAILGTSMMLVQNDIKKTLGYSTIGQMGYMIMECGLGAFSLAIFHLIAHGLFKATIFLNCGNVINLARQDPKSPQQPSTQSALAPVSWVTGLVISLVLPLLILLAAHHLLSIPLRDSQGLVIFLFFSWVTASQAMLTLYRVRGAGMKTHSIMLLTLVLVISAYLFAAEQFTHFLYPVPGVVNAYFQAAALPSGLFASIIAAFVLLITAGWIMAYANRNGRTLQLPERIKGIQTTLYLFFMNRLYLDAIASRVFRGVRSRAEKLDRHPFFLPVVAAIAIGLASREVTQLREWSPGNIALFFLTALVLPLFPFHGVYVAALTRLSGALVIVLSIVMPIVGVCGLTALLPVLPPELLRGISVLAVCGALYASMKALVQVSVPHLLAYGGLAFYSILWWHLANTGSMTSHAVIYAGAAALVTGGLLLGWDRVRVRYGNLDLNSVGGLVRPMPRLAMFMSLLVMAAVGLPPFGLFFGYLGMLLSSSVTMSFGLLVVFLTWFAASWNFFKLTQRLLFGPHRTDLRYEDLRPAEIAPFVVVLMLVLALGAVPHEWLEASMTARPAP